MKKPKLNLQSLGTLGKIAKAEQIVIAMTGSPVFTNPNPPLGDITNKAQEVQNAFDAAADGSNSAETTLIAREKELDKLLTQEASYVSSIAAGDQEIIESAGMEASDEASPSELPGSPQNLKLTDNKNISGSVKALWKKEKNAKSYVIYIATETVATPPAPPSGGGSDVVIQPQQQLSALPVPPPQPGTGGFALYDICTTSRTVISGLIPGKRVWAIVFAVGAAGKSGWSDPATIISR